MKKSLIRGEMLLFSLSLLSLLIVGVAGLRQKPEPLSVKLPDSYLATSMEFSPDGKRLAIIYKGMQTPQLTKGQIADVKSGAKLRDLQMPKMSPESDNIGHPAWSPDGKQLVAPTFIYSPQGSFWSISLWDAGSGKLRTPAYSTSGVTTTDRLRFSPDGKRIIGEGVPRAIFDVATGKRLNQPDALANSYGYSVLSENGQWLASVRHQDQLLRVRDMKTKRILWQPKVGYLAPFRWCGDVLCVKQEEPLGSGTTQSRLLLWNAKTRQQLPALPARSGYQMFDFAFSPDKRTLVYFNESLDPESTDNKVEAVAWDYIANRVLWRTTITGIVMLPNWSLDGERLHWLTSTDREHVYNLTVLDKRGKPRFKRESVGLSTTWSRDSKQLAFNALTVGEASSKNLSSRVEVKRVDN